MSLLNCLESVIMWWSTDITQFLIATIFPYCIVDSRAFIWSRFITSRLLFLLSCFTYSLPQNPLKVKEILLIFSATPGSFMCWTINRRKDHSIKVHCYIKYVRNLKKKKKRETLQSYHIMLHPWIKRLIQRHAITVLMIDIFLEFRSSNSST